MLERKVEGVHTLQWRWPTQWVYCLDCMTTYSRSDTRFKALHRITP